MDTRAEDLALLRQIHDTIKGISEKESLLEELQEECEEPFPYQELSINTKSDLFSTLEQKYNTLREKEWKAKKRIAKWIAWCSVLINLALVAFSCFWLYTNAWGMEMKIFNDSLGTDYFVITVLGGICVALIPRINPFFIFHRSKSKDESKKSNNPWLIVLILASIEPYFIYLLLHLLFPLVMLQNGITAVILVLIVTITVISRIFSKKLSREPAPIDYEYISNRHSAQLRNAAEQDEKNEKINESNRTAALKKKQDEYQPKIDACQKELDALILQRSELAAKLSDAGCLSNDDMELDILSFLIQQLEKHKADSVQDALQQYVCQPKYIYTGKDWDNLSAVSQLNAKSILELEKDLFDLFNVLAHTPDTDFLATNWLARICNESLYYDHKDPIKVQTNRDIRNKIGNVDNWYLSVAGLATSYISLACSFYSLAKRYTASPVYDKPFSAKLDESNILPPSSAKQKAFVDNITIAEERVKRAMFNKWQDQQECKEIIGRITDTLAQALSPK